MNPVTLPPGFARLATMPALTGSATCVNTTGIVRVACCKKLTAGVELTRITSGDNATNSIAAFGKSLVSQRYSICTLQPIGPAQSLQRFNESRIAGSVICIVHIHQYADALHALAL